ncbi:MAG: hypothetical protein IPL61_40065 [Myxococcales bacterium]|nr:hypothetical protein [Myxococcales bacterium]
MLVALLVQLALGLVYARVGRDRIRADGPSAPPAILLVLANAAIITVPIALYFYVVHPAWTAHYLVDPAKVPGLAVVPLVVCHGLVVIGGWYLGAALVRADRARTHLYGTIGVAVAAAVAVAALFPRLVAASSYQAYQDGVVGRLMSVELGWAILVSSVATAAAAVYVAIELSRDSRRVRSR